MQFSGSWARQCLFVAATMLSCGQVNAQCAEEIAELTESRADSHRTEIDKMRGDLDATRRDWQGRVLLHLNSINESFLDRLDGATDSDAQQKVRSEYRIQRDTYYFEEMSRVNRERTEIDLRTREARAQIDARYQADVRALKISEHCTVGSRKVVAEEPDPTVENDEWELGFSNRASSGLEDPADMNQAVLNFRNIQDLKKEKIEVAKNMDAYQAEREAVIHGLATVEASMAEIYGKTGLDAAKDRMGESIENRILNPGIPTPEEIDLIDPSLVDRRQISLDSFAQKGARSLRNDGFKEGLNILMEETLVDDKIRLIESHQQLTKRIEELDLLIDEGELRLMTIDSEVVETKAN